MLISHLYFCPDAGHPLCDDRDFLYLDIETTGLSRENSIIYMIGCGFRELFDEGLRVILWFNEDGLSEREILVSFGEFIALKKWVLVSFNGDRFDLPFLRARFEFHGLECPFSAMESLDLYRVLQPFKGLFGLDRARQKDWELALGIAREDMMSGRELIDVYRSFLMKRDERLFRLLVLHNFEDVGHLAQLAMLTGLVGVLRGEFVVEEMWFDGGAESILAGREGREGPEAELAGGDGAGEGWEDGDRLVVRVRTRKLLLVDIVRDLPEGRVYIKGNLIEYCLFADRGVMKHFFPDPENYYYLPREDRAIHKSVGVYVDRAFRERCRPQNCYVAKDGVFLPLYIPGQEKDLMKEFTLYQPVYRNQVQYVEYDELVSAGDEVKHMWVKGILWHFIL